MGNWWDQAVRQVFEGSAVITVGGVAAAHRGLASELGVYGAQHVLAVATEGAGVGAQPECETVVLEPPSGLSMMDRIRFGQQQLASPPAAVAAAVQRTDPERCVIVAASFLNEAPALLGRAILSCRAPEWVALEDKVQIDALWDRAGVPRLASRVVPVSSAPDAAAEVDEGHGTVWAADARDGYHGGASHTHWVGEAVAVQATLAKLRPVCDRVRVMPFIDGIPCAIHGFVLPDGVAVLRPIEMVTLRRGQALAYAGCASFWDPPGTSRAAMRTAARRVGALLRDEVGFRGAFTIDGVIDERGFWPTELNPRFGAGLGVIAAAEPALPMLLLHHLIVAGLDVGVGVEQFEDTVLTHADRHRSGGTWATTCNQTRTANDLTLAFAGGRWARTTEPEHGAATVSAGPGFTRCDYRPEVTPVGPSTAPRAAAFWAWADEHLDTHFGPVTPAPQR